MDRINYCMRRIFITVISVICSLYVKAQTSDLDIRVDELLSKMTLDEKVGQLNQYNGFLEITGPAIKSGDKKLKYDHLKRGLVGSVFNVYGSENVRQIQKLVVENSRLGIPLIFGYDVLHGYQTTAPIPLAEAASWDMDAIKQSARVMAVETSAAGINWTFAPAMDIGRDPRWGRVMESAGEDTYLASRIAEVRVKGLQGNDLSDNNTIAACAKHFAAYGFAEGGKDYNTVDIGTYTLFNFVLPPFKAAVDAGVCTVMNSFNILNGIPATGSAFLQRDILKNRWSFDGFVVSDWASGYEMITHGFTKDLKEVAEKSILSGSDMDMESRAYINHLKELVEEGRVPETTVDDAVRRILKVKFRLGLFDDPYKYCDTLKQKELIGHPDHHHVMLDMARKSIVLLKNQNDLLPLRKSDQKIAVIGALAADKDSPLGNWRARAIPNSAVSVLEGLREYKNNDVIYSKGADLAISKPSFISEIEVNNSDKSEFKEAVTIARNADVVLMVLGEHGYHSGEGRSRAHLGLPGVQQDLLEAVYSVNPNIVLILMNGRPLTIPWAAENIPAILETWHLGSQSGNAIAQVLYGDYNPGAKLPMTFPRSVGQIPVYYNHYRTGRPNDFGNVFWTHYIDESNEPLYPFGYGLSYTTFTYSNLNIVRQESQRVKVSVDVQNTGNRKGEEVVQLYVNDRFASVVRPVKELKGFKKIELLPGEKTTVELYLTEKELGFFTPDGEFVVEPGWFDVMVGTNSNEGLRGEFLLGEDSSE